LGNADAQPLRGRKTENKAEMATPRNPSDQFGS
jgi:hypothetical protein